MTVRETLESLFAAWRGGDALRAAAHFSADGAYREAHGEPVVGRDALIAFFTRFFRDGPRWELFVDDVLVDGDRAAVRYRFAVHAAAGSRRERDGCALVVVSDGAILEWREYEG